MRDEKAIRAELEQCKEMYDQGQARHEHQTRDEMVERIATLRWVLDHEDC